MPDDTRHTFNCPVCSKPLNRPMSSVGKRDRCPMCGEPFIVPPPKPDTPLKPAE